MEWFQFVTLMGTIVAGVFAFYRMTRDEINVIREEMRLMDTHHREDMKSVDDKWERMDNKWERLFERLLIKDGK